MTKVLLHIEDVYKSYGSKLVLDDIDLKVSQGELCTVIGPSGCGKSTLLRLVLGQERATKGQILFEGQPIGYPDETRGIVYQKYSLYPHLTVRQNITLSKSLKSGFFPSSSQKKSLIDESDFYLKKVRLEGHGDKYPHELSGGMRQRVAIAQALICKPKILLMDEPFGALDPGTREDMQIFLLELWEETNMTIFFVTHDLEEAAFIGTRLLVISQFYKNLDNSTAKGAKLVADYKLSNTANSAQVKQSKDFSQFIAKVRQEGFDPQYLQHVTEFNLKHPDSFQTL